MTVAAAKVNLLPAALAALTFAALWRHAGGGLFWRRLNAGAAVAPRHRADAPRREGIRAKDFSAVLLWLQTSCRGAWKCNAFVAYCICETGLTVPANVSFLRGNVYPPAANDWAQRNVEGWSRVNGLDFEPGLVVGHPDLNSSGHCGIVDFDGFAVGAGEFRVTRRFEGFLDGSCGYQRWTGNE